MRGYFETSSRVLIPFDKIIKIKISTEHSDRIDFVLTEHEWDYSFFNNRDKQFQDYKDWLGRYKMTTDDL